VPDRAAGGLTEARFRSSPAVQRAQRCPAGPRPWPALRPSAGSRLGQRSTTSCRSARIRRRRRSC